MAHLERADDQPKREEISPEKTASTPRTAGVALPGSRPGFAASGSRPGFAASGSMPSFAAACELVSAPYSCLVVDTHRRHVALSPAYLRRKRTGIREQLNAELLKYSESLKGVPLAYDDLKVVGQLGDIYDDNGFIHLNVQASFVVFQPKQGQRLLGVINKVGLSHVGLVVHGCFNASVPKPGRVSADAWQHFLSGLSVGAELHFLVSQLDADAAGVLLIRGRLDRHRLQELAAAEEAGLTEEPVDEPLPEEKDGVAAETNGIAVETDGIVNGVAVETNGIVNGVADGKKKKNKKRRKEQEAPVELHASDSSGYHSDKSGKRKGEELGAELDDGPLDPKPTKKKRKKKDVTLTAD